MVAVLFTFYIQDVLKLKKIYSGAKRLRHMLFSENWEEHSPVSPESAILGYMLSPKVKTLSHNFTHTHKNRSLCMYIYIYFFLKGSVLNFTTCSITDQNYMFCFSYIKVHNCLEKSNFKLNNWIIYLLAVIHSYYYLLNDVVNNVCRRNYFILPVCLGYCL